MEEVQDKDGHVFDFFRPGNQTEKAQVRHKRGIEVVQDKDGHVFLRPRYRKGVI